MVKITWTENALLDIEEIASFIEKDSFKAAQKQVLKFFAVEESLKSHTKVGRTVPEFLSEDVREIIVDNYRVIYKIISDHQVDILTVHHSKRLLRNNPAFKKS